MSLERARGGAFPIDVVTVDGKPVEVDTADAFWVMREAARAEGVNVYVVSGFRTMSEQRYLYRCYTTCSCNNCNLAARPGYSNHQSGSALDLNTSSSGVRRWLERNARRFGFTRTVPSEAWHYELTGAAAGPGPCTGPKSVVNGEWLQVDIEPGVHHVRYLSDGTVLGTSENLENRFAVRGWFEALGGHSVDAIRYDADDREVSRSVIELDVRAAAGEAPMVLALDAVSDLSWQRNGFVLSSETTQATRVAYYAGEFALGESVEPPFAVRPVFDTLGWRALLAVGYDGAGVEVARNTVLVRVLPGDETKTGPAVRFFARDGDRIANGSELWVAGSDSIERVRLSADGFELGTVGGDRGNFVLAYTFNRTGLRTLLAEALDADGNVVASHDVAVEIR